MGLYNIKLDMGKGRISELEYIKAKTTKTGKKKNRISKDCGTSTESVTYT